jgi:predicted nucleic acid-binding protein
MIFCIDANIFIWGLKKKCDPGDEDLMQRAIYFFEWSAENEHLIMIPTVALAEVLSSEPLERHPIIMELTKGCQIVDFDQMAAMRYSHLFIGKMKELKKKAQQESIDRQKMKIDHLIVACAIVNRANCIYSHDNGIRAFGQTYIDVKDLPPLPPPKMIQRGFFDGIEPSGKKLVNRPDNDDPF